MDDFIKNAIGIEFEPKDWTPLLSKDWTVRPML